MINKRILIYVLFVLALTVIAGCSGTATGGETYNPSFVGGGCGA